MPAKKASFNVPTIFIIFGVTGDLAGTKLLPALLNLYVKARLPERFSVVGVSRRHFSREELREHIRRMMALKPGRFPEEDIKHFFDHLSYIEGRFDSDGLYVDLAAHLKSIDDGWGQCSNKLFHLSVPPTLYEGILRNLAKSKLTLPCADHTGWTRVLVEKPFGRDMATARALDKLLGSLFKESQIFRIDHYLAKETLQNILSFRFHNALFEPIWDHRYVSRVHVKLLERETLSMRGALYDSLGTLKDVGQNHLLAMLALIVMERPSSFEAGNIRRERARSLSHLVRFSARTASRQIVRGQYEGFKKEKGVRPDSDTETYFRIGCHMANKRWKGVPFYLESGKAMAEDRVEIDVYFKEEGKHAPDASSDNILTFRIQPDEGIKARFFVKKPGSGFETEPKVLKFNYADSPSLSALPDAYERLIEDAIAGDQTLFASTEEIMASWKFIAPLLDDWHKIPLITYPKGAREV